MDGVVTLLPDNHSTGEGAHAHHGVTQHPEAGYEGAAPAAHHFPTSQINGVLVTILASRAIPAGQHRGKTQLSIPKSG